MTGTKSPERLVALPAAALPELLLFGLTRGTTPAAVLRSARDDLAVITVLAMEEREGARVVSLGELAGTLDGILRRFDVAIELLARGACDDAGEPDDQGALEGDGGAEARYPSATEPGIEPPGRGFSIRPTPRQKGKMARADPAEEPGRAGPGEPPPALHPVFGNGTFALPAPRPKRGKR